MISIRKLFLIAMAAVISITALPGQAIEQQKKTMGPVTIRLSLSPEKPVIGDLLELDIEVTANPKVEILMPEFGEALGRFQIVDFTPREKLDPDGQTVYSQKYKLQSPPSGSHFIPPILIEFVDRRPGEQQAPKGMDAYELLTDRINFEVQPVTVESASRGLQPPLGRIERRAETDEADHSVLWAILIATGSLIGGGVLAILASRLRKRVIRRTAYELAKSRLDRLMSQPMPKSSDVDSYYVELTSIIRTYLENRFDLRAPELTTEEFMHRVADSAELTPDHKKRLQDFLKHADLVKFAGVLPSEQDVQGSLETASRFLEETRENSPLLEIDPDSEHPTPRPVAGQASVSDESSHRFSKPDLAASVASEPAENIDPSSGGTR